MTGGDLLRDVTEDDLPIFLEHQLDPDATRMAAFTSRDAVAFMAHWTKLLGDATVVAKTIVFSGRVAGEVMSFDYEGAREVGYWLGRDFWGKGIATEALAEFLRHEKTRPLCAGVAPHNVASIRVLEKCGFAMTGEDSRSTNARGEAIVHLLMALKA